jgi:hypothetical protein
VIQRHSRAVRFSELLNFDHVKINTSKSHFLSSGPKIRAISGQQEKGFSPLMHVIQRPGVTTGRILQAQPPPVAVDKITDSFTGILDLERER